MGLSDRIANRNRELTYIEKTNREQTQAESFSRRHALDISTPTSLVNEMLDKLWENLTVTLGTTFLDPAFGRGTFLRQIFLRLMDEPILVEAYPQESARENYIKGNMLYGFEVEDMFVKLLHNQGYTNVIKQDALQYGGGMQFDVVIGNPPYQSTEDGSKRKKAWVLFSKKAIDLSLRFVAFVTPQTWKLGSKYFISIKKEIVSRWIAEGDANKYFIGVGEDIGWWITDNEAQTGLPEPELPLPHQIFAKVSAHKQTDWHYRDFQVPQPLSKIESNEFSYPTYWTANQIRWAKPEEVRYKGWKVIINNSGAYVWEVTKTKAVGLGAWGVKASSEEEAQNLSSWLGSNLYKVITLQTKTGGFNNPVVELPYLGVDHNWTDEELYAHFNLTQEEIEYIEANVK